jgi:DNA replication and repair protein RecF
LRQRNSILAGGRDHGRGSEEGLLDSWDETLVRTGSTVANDRLRYVAQLKHALPDRLFGAEEIRIHYLSSVAVAQATLPEIQAAYRAKLAQARAVDEAAGFTSVGPHRDDLKIFADGKAVSTFGSAGQQRSALLSLYFAQMEIHRNLYGFYPVFMVDDVEAELDDLRLGLFLELIGKRTQTFLTTAKAGLIPSLEGSPQRFEVASGAIVPA